MFSLVAGSWTLFTLKRLSQKRFILGTRNPLLRRVHMILPTIDSSFIYRVLTLSNNDNLITVNGSLTVEEDVVGCSVDFDVVFFSQFNKLIIT